MNREPPPQPRMTRAEQTGKRSLDFSRWIRHTLPESSTGFMVTNQDWVFWDFKRRRLLLAEEKCFDKPVAPWMIRFIKDVLDPALRSYCPNNGIRYYGYHYIRFQHTGPDNGLIYFDDRAVTPGVLADLLAMSDHAWPNTPGR